MSIVVPFRRELHHGMKGEDVIAYKRALSRAGYMEWGSFTPLYGDIFSGVVGRFQKDKGLRADKEIGRLTHQQLLGTHRKGYPKEWAFDSRSAWLMSQVVVTTPQERIRAAICAAAYYAYSERDVEYYLQYRPMSDMAPPPNVPNKMDCSQFGTWCYHSGGAPDPSHNGYNGIGNTTTMRQHGTSIPESKIQKGDLVFYTNPDHVGVYVGSGRVIEMGSSMGPLLISMHYRHVIDIRSYI